MEDPLKDLFVILMLLRERKQYDLADRLKKWLEKNFKIEIGYTQNSMTYNERYE